MTSFENKNLTNPRNDTGFGKVIPEFKLNNQTLRHNNMTPYFGAKLTQNMQGTGNDNSVTPYSHKLAGFTGIDEVYRHKREVGTLFNPTERVLNLGHVNPRETFDRYKVFLRHGESPVEKIRVTPGMGLEHNEQLPGGFYHYRMLPKNVGEYKKNQLASRVNAGKGVTNYVTSSYQEGVHSNRPEKAFENREPLPSGSRNLPTIRSTEIITVNKGKQTRGNAALSNAPGSTIPRTRIQTINRTREETNRSTSLPLPVGQVRGKHWGVNREGISVPVTGRGTENIHITNSSRTTRGEQRGETAFTDGPKVTRRETTEYTRDGYFAGRVATASRYQYEGDIEHFDPMVLPIFKNASAPIEPMSQSTVPHRRGGMVSNNLRSSNLVVDYVRNPGRNVARLDAPESLVSYSGSGGSENGPGTRTVQQVGGGTILQARTPIQHGQVKINTKRIHQSSVYYNNLNLKSNPFSIHFKEKEAQPVVFFKHTKPAVKPVEKKTFELAWKK